MRVAFALALLGAAGSGCSGSPAPAMDKERPMPQDVAIAELDWSLTALRDPARLRIAYTVHNRSSERLYLCDQLAVVERNHFVPAPTAILVMNGERPGQVRLIRGEAVVDKPSTLNFRPGGRAVDPGQSASGEAEVPLPLKAWHNYGYLTPLRGRPETAVLEVAYAVGEGEWGRLPLEGGGELVTPQPSVRLRYLVSDPRPIPAP